MLRAFPYPQKKLARTLMYFSATQTDKPQMPSMKKDGPGVGVCTLHSIFLLWPRVLVLSCGRLERNPAEGREVYVDHIHTRMSGESNPLTVLVLMLCIPQMQTDLICLSQQPSY